MCNRPKKKPERTQVGAWGEAIAARYLAERGYTVRDRNWRAGHGELDIVAECADVLIFVEVRVRRSDQFGTPEESLTARKRAKLIETAQAYLQAHELFDRHWQIDVIAIEMDHRNAVKRLEHYKCAVEGASNS
ncbi:MAG: YraN family protein [Anaerolineae bacterium]|nr:YraN family protein [Thermoflexales bacterium]MDW8408314.1 YraN family protein [Anaerolineae bacterium]